MNVALDQLESLWPPYRGAVLLGAARESQGRVSNARVVVVAGHVALSLEVDSPAETRGTRGDHQPAFIATAASTSPAVDHGPRSLRSLSPALRLTVLLDAVPDSAPKPRTHQMARFLTKVLSQAPEEAGGGNKEREDGMASGSRPGGGGFVAAAVLPGCEEGLLGRDVPEMLVVEHTDEVVLSEFVRFEHKADPKSAHGKSSTGVGNNAHNNSSSSSSSSLLYACVEANGLLRLWKWGAEGANWSWSFLNKCNICACREDPIGCRVLAAAMVPEPGEGPPRVGNRHRLVWEQEDGGEGAGLGLSSIPAAGTRPPRRVWSRRVTYDLEDGDTGDSHGAQAQQQQRYQQEDGENDEIEAKESVFGGGGGGGDSDSNTRAEVALAFSACLMPTGVDALLCSEVGVWMPTGTRVFFNHFATGRLPEVVVPILPARSFPAGGHHSGGGVAGAENGGDKLVASEHGSENGAFMDAESNPENGVYAPDGSDDAGGAGEGGAAKKSSWLPGQDAAEDTSTRRLFSVHDSTGDLMVYDHPGAIRVVSFSPSEEGGLRLGAQCTLDPPPLAPPSSLMARFNVAVLCGGGLCSAYDLCTGHLLGTATVPRCPVCAFRRRHRSANSSSVSPSSPCTCGRRHTSPPPRAAATELNPGFAAAVPSLWNSRTRGHLAGVLTATQVLRIRLPTAEACLATMLHAPGNGGGSVTSAPLVLRYAREHGRLVGAAGDACPASLLPEVLLAQGLSSSRGVLEPAGVRTVDLLGRALAAEERGWPARNGSRRGSLPPWLLVVMMSSEKRGGETLGLDAETDRERATAGGGDPAAAAAEMTLRTTLERRVSESLRSLDAVRALLQDPAASARQDNEGRGLRAAQDEAAEKLASLTASVDPATALFEGTLREWLACGAATRKDAGDREDGETSARGGRGVNLRRQGGAKQAPDAESSGRASDDALALAFRCEAAGDTEAMAIPFLQFLLEGSAEESGQAPGGGSGGGTLAPSSSTFLCIHLAGNVASPLFEVACRALFRLRARKLPRFVERLARFRAYAAAMTSDVDLEGGGSGGGGGGAGGESGDERDVRLQRQRERRHSRIPSDVKSETAGDAGGPVKVSATVLSARRGSSTASAEDRTDEFLTPALRPPSPTPSSSRRASDNSASATGDILGSGGDARAGRGSNRATSAPSRECSPDPASAPAPSTLSALSDEKNSDAPARRDEKRNASIAPIAARTLSAPAYFSRALACLPPATEDGEDGSQRRARLALLMGACMFTDACGLLRARSWEGLGGSWRGDRGADEAWGAAVRLLGELKRAAAEGEEREELATAAGDGDAAATSAAAVTGTAGPPPPAYGDVALQFRLAFEDALAETILADCPERMRAVMGCRPSGLTPVAVVRMVRRAAEAAEAAGDVGVGCRRDLQPPDRTEVGGQTNGVHHPALRGSTQTLKRCLLLLLEDSPTSSPIHGVAVGS